jgi:hypothetical protein
MDGRGSCLLTSCLRPAMRGEKDSEWGEATHMVGMAIPSKRMIRSTVLPRLLACPFRASTRGLGPASPYTCRSSDSPLVPWNRLRPPYGEPIYYHGQASRRSPVFFPMFTGSLANDEDMRSSAINGFAARLRAFIRVVDWLPPCDGPSLSIKSRLKDDVELYQIKRIRA